MMSVRVPGRVVRRGVPVWSVGAGSRFPSFAPVRDAGTRTDIVLLTLARSAPPSIAMRPGNRRACASLVASFAADGERIAPFRTGVLIAAFRLRCARALRRVRR